MKRDLNKICLTCKTPYYAKPYRIKVSKFCSHACYSIDLTKRSSWNKGKKLTHAHKKKLSIAKIGTHRTEATKQKISLSERGSNHYNWRGGVTPKNETIRKSREYREWRKAVFERDNYTCVWGGKAHGSKLQADHIKPFSLFPELRFSVENGRTLCIPCNRTTDTYGYNVKFYRGGFI